jgi:uncharacterized membrane protein YfcA
VTGGLDPGVFTLVLLAVLLGAVVQTVVGLGLGLVAAPVVTLLAPALMPGVMITLACVLPLLTLAGERRDIDWRGLSWSLPPRVLGTVVGVAVVARFSDRQLGILIGVIVLLAVLLTWHAVRVPVTRGTLIGVGLVSGITGTATSIGGPPFAILYQHRPARQIRTTMAVYFLVGAAMSLVGLAIGGDLTTHEVAVGALLLPAVAVGAVVGVPLRRRLPAGVVRPAVLAVCGASALVLVVRSLV